MTGQTFTRSAVGNHLSLLARQRSVLAGGTPMERLRANLEAASKRDALPHPEDHQQLVDQKLIEPLSNGEGVRLLRVGRRVLEVMRAANPDAAVSGESAARGEAGFRLAMGETVHIPDEVVSATFDVLRPHLGIVPRGTKVVALTRVEPAEEYVDVAGGRPFVNIRFTTPDGRDSSMTLRWDTFSQTRAFATVDGSTIGFTRFALVGEVQEPTGQRSVTDTRVGELVHELVHALRRRALLRGAAWDRLLGHANFLDILNRKTRDYLKMVGDPGWRNSSPQETLREAYEQRMYNGTTDLRERMDQEAVAHMAELYVHGQLSDQDIAPVRDLLEALVTGELSGPTASGLHAPPVTPPITAERQISDAASAFLEALKATHEQQETVRSQIREWREQGQPVSFEDFTGLLAQIAPRKRYRLGQIDRAMEALQSARVSVEPDVFERYLDMSPNLAIGGGGRTPRPPPPRGGALYGTPFSQ
jgi:hypothetical protein